MKRLLLIFIALWGIPLAVFAQKDIFLSPKFNELTKEHKVLAIIPFKILGISDFFNEIILNNKKVYPKKLLENGFVFKFDYLKKIMTL